MTKTETVDTVLAFWFEESTPEQWFKKDDVFDATIRNRFEPTIISSLKGEKDSWADMATGCLALIILLDQFTRNIYRDTPRAFSGDEMALALSLRCLDRGYLGDAGRQPAALYADAPDAQRGSGNSGHVTAAV
jgi:uncharacterized protein (DUF924 family)